MKVVWSQRAIDQLVAIRKFIEKDSDGSAALVAGRILDAIEILRTQPHMGRPGRTLHRSIPSPAGAAGVVSCI
jgi:toxin ParE1/3/4